jgi:hypothetical protein
MDKSTPEKFAKTMLKEMAQIRAVVESLHDINTELLHHLSGSTGPAKAAIDKQMLARLKKQHDVIYASLLKQAGLSD